MVGSDRSSVADFDTPNYGVQVGSSCNKVEAMGEKADQAFLSRGMIMIDSSTICRMPGCVQCVAGIAGGIEA